MLKPGVLVNLSWSPSQPVVCRQHPEAYYATVFSSQGRLEIPELSLGNMGEFEDVLDRHIAAGHSGPPVVERRVEDCIHLYVCTHGARDCRCGDIGGKVARALRDEIRHRLERDSHDAVLRSVRLAEVGHVGGHQLVTFFSCVTYL
jgi:hypothetical protein